MRPEEQRYPNNWEQRKAEIKARHPHLSEDDLNYQAGKEEGLLERLQMKTGMTKKEIRDWLGLRG